MGNDHESISRWQNDTLPHVVDRLAKERPEAVYGLWPVAPASYEAGFRTITYAKLANVINGLAWFLVEQLGGPGKDSEVLTYVGPNDVRLTALGLAAIKAGYALFLTSPRNSPAAHRALFDALKCKTFVTTDPLPAPAHAIIEAVKPRKLVIPTVDELLEKTYPHFSYDKPFEEARWDPVFIIHTSGSTGLPKPLIWTQETAVRHINSTSVPNPDGLTSIDSFVRGKRVLSTLPSFHGAGLCQYFYNAIPFGTVIIAPAAAAIATGQGVVDALRQTPAEVAIVVPSVVAELAQSPELLDECAKYLEMIIYIGGDLPQSIGDRVASKIQLRCQWGASEVGIPQQIIAPGLGPTDWRYVRFHPGVGADFEEVTEGNYELVIRHDEALASTQPSFSIRGQENLEKGYRTRDLFAKHPTVADAWAWQARADDIIVFLNGEKTNPVSMEQHVVASNPELGGAIVLGSQRFQAALLIEPASDAQLTTAEEAALIERVWPSVEEANKVAPAHARVEKALILVTSHDRPLIRAGKGTLQKSASLAQYTEEIDRLYAHADATPDDDGDEDGADGQVNLTDAKTVATLIRDSIQAVTGWSSLDDDSATFFDLGLDSLQALQLTRALRRSLHRPDLALPTIYQNPTVPQLTSALLAENASTNDRDLMEPFLATYRGLIQQIPKPKVSADAGTGTGAAEGPVDVVLTGSTGTLGTYLLRALLDRPGVGNVFCLNRSENGGRAVQSERFAAAGLSPDGLDDRVTFLQADLAHPTLGLDAAAYETLRARAGLIIHNAWPVNFNLGLTAFRPQLAGLVNLFALSAAAAAEGRRAVPPRVVFVSSVGAVGGRPADAGPAPEEVLASLDTPYANGYARSKLLSELLCDEAARHLGIPAAVARVGQVAGPVRRPGLWNRAEWFPSLVVSSLHLGCLPDNLGPQFTEVDWVPSDLLADAIVDLALPQSQLPSQSAIASSSSSSSGADVFNLRNPKTVRWGTLLPAVREAVRARAGRDLDVVAPSAWVSRLQGSMAALTKGDSKDVAAAAASNPAIKLLDFYRDGLWMAGAESQGMSVDRALASPTLRDMPPVGQEWVRKWVHEWIPATTA
ncbi:putative NRPS-like protein biosynthetic cluster [Diatrype stigma]|uniref:NRPS-like protein biosynthetic cluster n=1 Tax=Diatrype stigma TaxID=117547 RepID=A0AAN9YT32_9PEZI